MDRAAHLAQAGSNASFGATIDHTAHSDWVVTVMFYEALHYVDAFLATKNEHPAKHEQRSRMIQSHPQTSAVFNEYRRLQSRSNAARYDGVTYSLPQIESLRTIDLAKIKSDLG